MDVFRAKQMYIDSHAHIDRHFFGDGLPEVLSRFRQAGVDAVVTVGSSADIAVVTAAVETARENPDVFAVIGCHPHDADRLDQNVLSAIEELATDSRVKGIGETGLDYHYDFSSREGQRRAFEVQLDLSYRLDLPVVIHCREAVDDCMAVVRSARLRDVPGQIHCFTGNAYDAKRWLDLGFMISIPGVVTFRNVAELVEAVRVIPDDRLLIETDSPYLAPVPMRGRINEPANIVHTARAVAVARETGIEDVARVTSANARRLFRII